MDIASGFWAQQRDRKARCTRLLREALCIGALCVLFIIVVFGFLWLRGPTKLVFEVVGVRLVGEEELRVSGQLGVRLSVRIAVMAQGLDGWRPAEIDGELRVGGRTMRAAPWLGGDGVDRLPGKWVFEMWVDIGRGAAGVGSRAALAELVLGGGEVLMQIGIASIPFPYAVSDWKDLDAWRMDIARVLTK